MAFARIVLFLLTLGSLLHLSQGLTNKRQDVRAQTGFLFKNSQCSSSQQAIIEQAQNDALALANAALDDGRDELIPTTGYKHRYIDFYTQAAIEYFGAPDANLGHRQRVFDTLYRATEAYAGWGWSDYWSSRYIQVRCNDKWSKCKPTAVAYYHNKDKTNPEDDEYSSITYCPNFFDRLRSHADVLNDLQKDEGKRLNVRNMRSRATTVLHEWLHIRDSTAEICQGGCFDTWQAIHGGFQLRTYKPGLAKLLARKEPKAAASTNDNYVYFAMSRFVEKTFKQYPAYPRMWDNDKTKKQNEDLEDLEPGAPPRNPSVELEDSGIGDRLVSAQPLPVSKYPAWYRPLLENRNTIIHAPQTRKYLHTYPEKNNVVCQTTSASAAFDDCVHAFGGIEITPNWYNVVFTKGIGVKWWPGYVHSCAIQIHYKGDWSNCRANWGDVWAHAMMVFEGCHGGLATVGGYVPLSVANCPATIDIVPTNGGPAPGLAFENLSTSRVE